MSILKKIYKNYKAQLLLLLIYFTFHLPLLTLLPIFNDESIYLDWAWSYTHMSGHLYDSLLDAKQPLLLWIFGIFERIFADPLFAGRFVSVLLGAITMLGIYVIAQKMCNRTIAWISAALYIIIPLFIFYNRQALMESAISCVGVWSFYFLYKLLSEPSRKNSALLGAILGLGFFIKTSSLLFIIPAISILLFYLVKDKKRQLFHPFLFVLTFFFAVDFLLIINPLFWQTFSSNSRYSYTILEIFSFPILSWMHNLFGFFEISFIFITPLLFCFSSIGSYFFYKNGTHQKKLFLSYFFAALLLEILGGKFQSQRYIVAFLPFLVVPAAYILFRLWQGRLWKKIIVINALLFPLIFSLLLIIKPEQYILQSSKISQYAEIPYIKGQTSGYGIAETMLYIKGKSNGVPTLVLFSLNSGNPENAINLYSQRALNLYPLHIDKRFFPDITQYECLSSTYPVFFITRNDELADMQIYFQLEKTFRNPYSDYSVKIYTLKKDCEGKSFSLSTFYNEAMQQILLMK